MAAKPVRPIIVKKVIEEAHAGHHGGAWKVAYADFVTAMMAFFLLMWLIGATTEKQRKALADYFSPTLIQKKEDGAGSNGVLGGRTIAEPDDLPNASPPMLPPPTTARDDTRDPIRGPDRRADRERFDRLREGLEKRLKTNAATRPFARSISFTSTREGLRIDLVDDADFSMFALGTDRMTLPAMQLMAAVADVVKAVPNPIIVRGHTDALGYGKGAAMSNWSLSAARAETTRRTLALRGVAAQRFNRIEGVADREPYNAENPLDPKNRRISITLAWATSGQ